MSKWMPGWNFWTVVDIVKPDVSCGVHNVRRLTWAREMSAEMAINEWSNM